MELDYKRKIQISEKEKKPIYLIGEIRTTGEIFPGAFI